MKRFYTKVEVAGDAVGFRVELDGRVIRTPRREILSLPTQALADVIAEEWRVQEDAIVPATMPLTRLANSSIDAVTPHRETVVQTVADYGATDLLCYRADGPADLVAAQGDHWQPLIDWIERRFGARLTVTTGIAPVQQPAPTLAALTAAVAEFDDYGLAALHDFTTITGSVVIALALADAEIDIDRAWAAAQVDEAYQAAKWGEDAEAAARRDRLRLELAEAKRFLDLLSD